MKPNGQRTGPMCSDGGEVWLGVKSERWIDFTAETLTARDVDRVLVTHSRENISQIILRVPTTRFRLLGILPDMFFAVELFLSNQRSEYDSVEDSWIDLILTNGQKHALAISPYRAGAYWVKDTQQVQTFLDQWVNTGGNSRQCVK